MDHAHIVALTHLNGQPRAMLPDTPNPYILFGMYEVRVHAGFSAAHQVRMYDDALEPIHGHDWKVEAVFRGPELDRIGVLIDFVAVQRALDEIVAQLHHTHLNEAPMLAG